MNVVRVGRVARDLGIVGQNLITTRCDNRESAAWDRHVAGSGCDTAVYFQSDSLGAGEAVIAADLIRPVSDLDSGNLNRAGFGVVRNLCVISRHNCAVDDIDGKTGGNGDVDRAVLIGNSERYRNGSFG